MSRLTPFGSSALSHVFSEAKATISTFALRFFQVAVLTVGTVICSHRDKGLADSLIVGFSTPLLFAGPTVSPISRFHSEVVAAERVSVNAMRLASLMCDRAIATQQIHPVRHGLKMRGIATGTIPAKVIEFHPRWDGTDQQFVSAAMRFDPSSEECRVPVPRSLVTVAWIWPTPLRAFDRSPDVALENRQSPHSPTYKSRPYKDIDRGRA